MRAVVATSEAQLVELVGPQPERRHERLAAEYPEWEGPV